MRNVRVASVQFEVAQGDKEANLATIRRFVRQAAEQRVEIIAFPEDCITGSWFQRNLSREQMLALAEPVFDGPSSSALRELSREHGMTIGAGLIELADDGKLYTTYVVAMPDGQCARHRKLHAFLNECLSCGSEYTVFDTPHGCRVGVLICYDNNIFENVRMTALKGADILLAPHQTGGCDRKNPNAMTIIDRKLWDNRHQDPAAIETAFVGQTGRGWITRWLPSRAHDNGLFIIFSNGVGPDDNEIRTGNAMVIDCYGRIIAETCKAADDMVVADLDASLLKGCTGRRWMKARRPDLYGPLAVPTGTEQDTRSLRMGPPVF